MVRQALWALKYEGNKIIAKLFAVLIYDSLIEILSDMQLYEHFTKPLIIPLPLSKERYKERGWNQSELIANELQKISPHWKVEKNILKKI